MVDVDVSIGGVNKSEVEYEECVDVDRLRSGRSKIVVE